MTKRPEGLLKQPVNDRYNDGSDKREKGIGYRKKEIGPEQSDTFLLAFVSRVWH